MLHYYVGVPLSNEDSWVFQNVATSRFCNTRTDMKGDRVNWLTIKWLFYLKEDPETLLFKYRMADDFKQLKIKGKNTRGRQTSFILSLPRRYSAKLLLSGRRICWIFATWGWYHKSISSSTNLTQRQVHNKLLA